MASLWVGTPGMLCWGSVCGGCYYLFCSCTSAASCSINHLSLVTPAGVNGCWSLALVPVAPTFKPTFRNSSDDVTVSGCTSCSVHTLRRHRPSNDFLFVPQRAAASLPSVSVSPLNRIHIVPRPCSHQRYYISHSTTGTINESVTQTESKTSI